MSISVLSCFAYSILLHCISAMGPEASGKATFYGGNDNGNACGYSHVDYSSFPNGFYAACGASTFDNGYGCGACYEVTCVGPYGNNPNCRCDPSTPSVVIQCMDQCPECSATHLDLNPNAMNRIVASGLAGTCGIIETRFRRVPCDYRGNIKIRSKSGTSQYWYGLHIDDVANYGSIRSVKLKSAGSSSWSTSCDKSNGASFFVCSGGYPLSAPLSVSLTDTSGQTLTCNGCIGNFNSGTEWDFGSNFGSGSSNGGGWTPPVSGPVTSSGTVAVKNYRDTQPYYLTFGFDNADCGITNVQVLEKGNWRNYDQTYTESGFGRRFAWNYNGVSFQDMLPSSVKVTTSSGSKDLWGVITDLGGSSVFSTSESVCAGSGFSVGNVTDDKASSAFGLLPVNAILLCSVL